MDSIDPAALSLSLHPRTPHVDPSPSPTPSASSLAAPAPPGVATTDSNLPPKPDRATHDAIKARYKVLQHKWHDLIADRTKLASDLEAAELKREKLQSEADMLIEQMHELAPEISLAPDYVDLSSDEADDTYDGYMHPKTSSSTYLDGRYSHHHDRRLSTSDSTVPSASINYFTGQLFGPNSGLDFDNDMAIQEITPSESSRNGKRSSNGGGHNGKNTHANAVETEGRQIMLSPEQAKEEEARIEQEQKARQRSKSYNPDNVKIRIGVMPSTFVHPLVHNNSNSNRSSKSRSPSTTSDQAGVTAGGDETTQSNSSNTTSNAGTTERPSKRPRTMSKEKSPIKEQATINEEEEPNPP